jgi:cellobiose phosphorylase
MTKQMVIETPQKQNKNQYGHFIDDNHGLNGPGLGHAFKITKLDIPVPFMNALGINNHNERLGLKDGPGATNNFMAVVTQWGGGFSFYVSAMGGRITQCDKTGRPVDSFGFQTYVRESDGTLYSPTWKPVMHAPDAYECIHGPGYTEIMTSFRNVHYKTRYFIPNEENAIVWDCSIRNGRKEDFKASLFPNVVFVPGNVVQEFGNRVNEQFYREAHYDTELKAIVAINKMGSDFGLELPPEMNTFLGVVAYMASSLPVEGYECLHDRFLGGQHVSPLAPGPVLENRLACGDAPYGTLCGALHHKINLPRDTELKYVVRVGVSPTTDYLHGGKAEILETFARWKDSPARRSAELFKGVGTFYADYFKTLNIVCPDEKLTTAFNALMPQVATVAACGRDAFNDHDGHGYSNGYRDIAQDIMGLVFSNPKFARRVIFELAGQMYSERKKRGYVNHNYSRDGSESTFTNHSDDPLWFVLAVAKYIKETGDFYILKESAKYYDSKEQSTIFQHCLDALDKVRRCKSARGIPLLLGGDWNDDINETGLLDAEKTQAESIFNSGLYCQALREMAELFRATPPDILDAAPYITDFCLSENDLASDFMTEYQLVKEATNKYAWDGEWYWRYSRNPENLFGSSKNEEGKIFFDHLPWLMISGVADEAKTRKCIASIEKHLANAYGTAIVSPAFTNPGIDAVTKGAPGWKETGGNFNHLQTWYSIAHAMRGAGKPALETLVKILPGYVSEDQARFAREPYLVAECTGGPGAGVDFGKATHPGLTGTVPWALVALSEYIFGFQPGYGGFTIDPCVPAGWKNFGITRQFRGDTYNISVENKSGVQKGVKEVWHKDAAGNWIQMPSNLIVPFNDGNVHELKVVMGEPDKVTE